jgi:cytochrome c
MEFLKDIAIPASLEHFRLLVLIAALSSIVYVPFVSFVFGSSILSLWFNQKQRHHENAVYLKLAHELIDIALYNKGLILFLAVLPGLSLVLAYAQMLQGTSSSGVSLEAFGFLFLLAGLILLFIYKYTFHVQDMIGSYNRLLQDQGKNHSDEKATLLQETDTHSYVRAGRYGIFFLLVAFMFSASAISVTRNPSSWENDSVFTLLLSLDIWLKVIELLLISTGITGIGILFFSFAWESRKEHTEEYTAFVRNLGVRLSMTGLLVLPVLVLFNAAALPASALSGTVYSFAGSVIILLFLSAHFIYGYHKTLQPSAITAGFALFLLAAAILIACDQMEIGTATRSNAVQLASNHEKSLEELRSGLGVTTVTFTGEDIYNARCFSCHLFDQKKVGPPYFETIPKYIGKKSELVTFILNPTKMNPAYSPMPNPGLRPAEADSIASYLMRRIEASSLKPVK